MRKARRKLCFASSSAARVQGAARGRLARRLACRVRRAIISLQSAARRARAYAVSRVPPRWTRRVTRPVSERSLPDMLVFPVGKRVNCPSHRVSEGAHAVTHARTPAGSQMDRLSMKRDAAKYYVVFSPL